jgi:predicted RNA-binding protein with PIN domain
MPLLIDGHNLIGQMPDLSLSDPNDEDKLTIRLRALADRVHKRITVVFDPDPHDTTPSLGHNRTQHGSLTVIYAPNGKKADDVIRHIVGDARDKQGLLVVTSDAAVANFTRQCGIRVQSCVDFIKWMKGQESGRPDPYAKPVGSAREAVNWADVFKEPDPPPNATAPSKAATPLKKKGDKRGEKRSEQLKQQVKRTRPLF